MKWRPGIGQRKSKGQNETLHGNGEKMHGG